MNGQPANSEVLLMSGLASKGTTLDHMAAFAFFVARGQAGQRA